MSFNNLRWISFVVAARFIARGRSGEATHALVGCAPTPKRDKSRSYAHPYDRSMFFNRIIL